MELFAFAGISNSTILLTAAAVLGGAAVISVILRNIGLSSGSQLANRVDRLEVRTASAGDYRAVISMASGILNGVDTHSAPHILEMFEDAGASNARLARNISAGEAAHALVNELKAGIEIAAAVARPIQNMVDNGSVEVRAERTRLAGDLRKQVAAIRTPTWDRHGAAILAAGVPSTTVTAVVNCFVQVKALKTSTLALSRNSSVDAFTGVLSQAASVLACASQSVDLFQGNLTGQPDMEGETTTAAEANHSEEHADEGEHGHADVEAAHTEGSEAHHGDHAEAA